MPGIGKYKKKAKRKRGFKMKSPLKHAPYAEAPRTKVAPDNTPEAHGKKTEDYYSGERGKLIQSTGARRDSLSGSYVKKK